MGRIVKGAVFAVIVVLIATGIVSFLPAVFPHQQEVGNDRRSS